MRYTHRLLDAGIAPSVGSTGDAYDNALAETVIGLFKTEVIQRRGPWRSLEMVEFAVLAWVHWFNTGCCLSRYSADGFSRSFLTVWSAVLRFHRQIEEGEA
jgi:hypothetical protein